LSIHEVSASSGLAVSVGAAAPDEFYDAYSFDVEARSVWARALAVEVDEIQHFTTDRLRTLDLYPPEVEVCFDVDTYSTLVGE